MFEHKLMNNNITKDDLDNVVNYIKKNQKEIILTQSKKVEKFEKLWSNWLGVKYSVFVNSGSSANLLSITLLKTSLNKGDEIIVPSLTWPSDIMAVILNDFKPIFTDVSLSNLSMLTKDIISKTTKKTKAIFITYAQGFNGLSDELMKHIKKNKLILIEDVCESHGAKFQNKKLGTFGLISNFSFYYAHHLSTIEGGMICTNNKNVFNTLKMLRGHGMVRETKDEIFEKKITLKYKDLFDKFIFLHPGYNMRNNEISAIIGISQLKRLNINIKKRNKNFKLFLKYIDKKMFYTNFDMKGISNYAFPLILLKKTFKHRNALEKIMIQNKIQYRRGNAGGGNQLRQPYLKKFAKKNNLVNFKNVEHIHHYGYYIGNYPSLKKNKIIKICKILNSYLDLC